MAVSTWLAQRNEKARARLMRNLPEVFPGAVLVHALSRPFLPATPRRTVDSYWRYHPIRADKLAPALAALSGAPEGWVWRVGIQKSGPLVSFRVPPTPFREPAYTKGPGHCCVCGQPIFRFGWQPRRAARPLAEPSERTRGSSGSALKVAGFRISHQGVAEVHGRSIHIGATTQSGPGLSAVKESSSANGA